MGGGSTKLKQNTVQPTPTITNSKPKNEEILKTTPQDNRTSGSSKSKSLTQVNIYFGSNSGTAEQFSYSLKSTLNTQGLLSSSIHFDSTLGVPARVVNLEEFIPRSLQSSSVAIFLVATHGEGEPTENAQSFAEWMANKDGTLTNYLENVNFAVFGLGDSTYQYFNQMGKTTASCLEKLGGHPIHPLTLGDASEDIDHDFENWREIITPIIKQYHEKKLALAPPPE